LITAAELGRSAPPALLLKKIGRNRNEWASAS
jgi:hypothetical protein